MEKYIGKSYVTSYNASVIKGLIKDSDPSPTTTYTTKCTSRTMTVSFDKLICCKTSEATVVFIDDENTLTFKGVAELDKKKNKIVFLGSFMINRIDPSTGKEHRGTAHLSITLDILHDKCYKFKGYYQSWAGLFNFDEETKSRISISDIGSFYLKRS